MPTDGVQPPPDTPLCGQAGRDNGADGAGHDAVETVAAMPVRIGLQCLPARLINRFGHYTQDGLAASLLVRMENGGESRFAVQGVRMLIRISSALARARTGAERITSTWWQTGYD